MYRIAVVGNRNFKNLSLVEEFVRSLPEKVCVISGGAQGVDTEVIKTAKAHGFETEEFLPDLEHALTHAQISERYYARNRKIVDESDVIIAFNDKTKGGTIFTIRYAVLQNKETVSIASHRYVSRPKLIGKELVFEPMMLYGDFVDLFVKKLNEGTLIPPREII